MDFTIVNTINPNLITYLNYSIYFAKKIFIEKFIG